MQEELLAFCKTELCLESKRYNNIAWVAECCLVSIPLLLQFGDVANRPSDWPAVSQSLSQSAVGDSVSVGERGAHRVCE